MEMFFLSFIFFMVSSFFYFSQYNVHCIVNNIHNTSEQYTQYTCRCFIIVSVLNHFHCMPRFVFVGFIGFMDPSSWCTYINCGKLHVYVRSTIPSHLPQRYGWLDIANKVGTKTWCWNVWVSGIKITKIFCFHSKHLNISMHF